MLWPQLQWRALPWVLLLWEHRGGWWTEPTWFKCMEEGRLSNQDYFPWSVPQTDALWFETNSSHLLLSFVFTGWGVFMVNSVCLFCTTSLFLYIWKDCEIKRPTKPILKKEYLFNYPFIPKFQIGGRCFVLSCSLALINNSLFDELHNLKWNVEYCTVFWPIIIRYDLRISICTLLVYMCRCRPVLTDIFCTLVFTKYSTNVF